MSTVNDSVDPNQFPTPADIEHFDQFGYAVSPAIIPDDLIAEANYGVSRYYAGERDWPLPISGGYLDWRPEHGDGLRINDYVSLQNRELRSLVMCEALGRAFSALSHSAVVRLFHDQLISKPPKLGDQSAIGWHVDGAYWRTCTSQRMLTAWIPLEDYEIEMGPIMIVPGSHRWNGNNWMTTFNDRDLDALQAKINTDGGQVERKPILIRPGQVSFHHAGTIHGSMPNRGARPRLALTVHVQDGDNRYRRHVDSRNKVATHVNDALCRKAADGFPDYSDPDICPVLWPGS
jgi:predicted enzyme related to lactoylglutathione lyase